MEHLNSIDIPSPSFPYSSSKDSKAVSQTTTPSLLSVLHRVAKTADRSSVSLESRIRLVPPLLPLLGQSTVNLAWKPGCAYLL